MKGVILAGGRGSRLYPLTLSTHKELLPVYDKPMIYYSLSTIMEAGIRDILIISTKEYVSKYKELLNDGKDLGINLSYTYEPTSIGTAQAFILAEEFIGDDNVCLIFADNIFLGNLKDKIERAVENANNNKATIFGYRVENPKQFGVMQFDLNGRVINLEEKPENPKSNIATMGLYVYPNDVVKYAKTLTPSIRGELEITDINKIFLSEGRLESIEIDEGIKWLDAGSRNSLLDSSILVRKLQQEHKKKYGCIHEIAYKNGWISKNELIAISNKFFPSDYQKDLIKFLNNEQ